MSLTITARFIMGTYQGRSPAGAPEPFPETDRLFSALAAAAGAGPAAEAVGGALRIAERHRLALEWLETNPPDSIFVPAHTMTAQGVTAYRRSGLATKGEYAAPVAKEALARSSLAGPVSWHWESPPPEGIMDSLRELAPEVAYLGEAASLVRVSVGTDVAPRERQLVRLTGDELFPVASVPVRTPQSGRLKVLEDSHAERLPVAPVRDGKQSQTEAERQSLRPDASLAVAWYRLPAGSRSAHFLPWDGAIIIDASPVEQGTRWPPRPEDHVAWSVALHRALAKTLSPDAPPLLTGRFPPGEPVPANRVAIQIVNPGLPLGWSQGRGIAAAFVLLMPSDATAEDQDAVIRAVQALTGRTIFLGKLGAVRLRSFRFVNGTEFWQPPREGTERYWIPAPLAVAETRSQKRRGSNAWGLEDAALLSIGMVWRDAAGVSGKGTAFYEALVEAVRARVRVLAPRQVAGQALTGFVHRAHPSTVVTGYTATLKFSDAVHPRAPMAIGQSRHLGTGLLVPVDLPAALIGKDGRLPWN